jgi:cytochrome c biogenesis protein CcmG, thiol:disulfide interchange protein DsbE
MVVAASLACSGDRAPARPVVEVGRPAPAYAATSLGGAEHSLGDLRGKVVLLNVWATWCAPCREEIPYLQSLYERNAARGFEIVGVSVDARGSEKAIEEFRRDFAMTYPIWLDPDERVQTLYMALGVPASYLIDRGGVLRWKHLGAIRSDDPMLTQALELALREKASE